MGRPQQPFLETPTHSTTTTNQLLLAGTNSQFVVVTQPFPGGDSPGSGESLLSNSPIKVIAGLPADVSEAPRSPSGTAPLSSSPDSDTMARRLDEVSAKGGDVQISLFWRNYNDLDLHCIDPKGVEIYYNNKRSAQTGGELDVDQNASTPYNAVPVENIYWPASGAPSGIYKVYVAYYAEHDVIDPTGYTVRTVVKGKTNFFSNTIVFAGQQKTHWICTIQFDPDNPNPGLRCRFLSR